MKDKVLKIILVITSLPFICILIEAIHAIFFGVSVGFFGDQTLTYGFDAFWICIVFRVMLLLQIGILPICIIYQLFYLIRHLVKKHKSKTVEINENTEQ